MPRIIKLTLIFLLILLGVPLLLLGSAYLVMLFPVNASYAPHKQGIAIYIYASNIHSDIILPLTTDHQDWRKVFTVPDDDRLSADTAYISIGWGDKNFYLNTPAWSDLKLSTAISALFWPTDSALRVDLLTAAPEVSNKMRRLYINDIQYKSLTAYILNTTARTTDGKAIRIAHQGYGLRDAFYTSPDRYHLFNTCNDWVNGGLKVMGVKTPAWSPLPQNLLYHLPQP